MSDKPKKLGTASKNIDKPRYEAPRILPLNRIGVGEGGTLCNPGTMPGGVNCGNGLSALEVCGSGSGVQAPV